MATLWDLWDRGTYFEGPGDFLPPVATTFMGPGGILKFLYQQWYNGGVLLPGGTSPAPVPQQYKFT